MLALAVSEQRVVVTTDIGDYYRLDAEHRKAGRAHYGIVIGHLRWSTSKLCYAFETALLNAPEDALRDIIVWAATVPAEP